MRREILEKRPSPLLVITFLPMKRRVVVGIDIGMKNTAIVVTDEHIGDDGDGGKLHRRVIESAIISFKSLLDVPIALLDMMETISTADKVGVERQVPKNKKAQYLAQHIKSCISMWMLLNGRRCPPIDDLDARMKSISFSAPKKVDLKVWCVEKATELMTEEEDLNGLKILASLKKKDDFCDAYLYTRAMLITIS